MAIKRYDVMGEDYETFTDPDGQFVMYQDYAALKDENNTLKTELAGEHYINAELRKEREYFRDESNRLAAENAGHILAFKAILEHCPVNSSDIDKACAAMIAYDEAYLNDGDNGKRLAELRAQAVEEFAETQKIAAINNDTDQWTRAVFIGAYNDARIYAAQIRAAAKGDNHG